MSEGTKPERKQFQSGKTLKKIMADHFYELDEASRTGSKKNRMVYKRRSC